MRLKTTILALVATAAFSACSDDTESSKDSTASGEAGLDSAVPETDLRAADEPFGRGCTEIGQACPDPDLVGYDLTCISLEGGTEGKGYCTRSCTDVGGECMGAPNGQYAGCLIQGEGVQFCAFLCRSKELQWACPPDMTCGEPNEQGAAVCLP